MALYQREAIKKKVESPNLQAIVEKIHTQMQMHNFLFWFHLIQFSHLSGRVSHWVLILVYEPVPIQARQILLNHKHVFESRKVGVHGGNVTVGSVVVTGDMLTC